jgi:hypothetical protein
VSLTPGTVLYRPMSLVLLELLELMKGRSGVALTQFSSSNSSNGHQCVLRVEHFSNSF